MDRWQGETLADWPKKRIRSPGQSFDGIERTATVTSGSNSVDLKLVGDK